LHAPGKGRSRLACCTGRSECKYQVSESGRYLHLAAGGLTPRAVTMISMEGGKSSETAGLFLAAWASDSGAEWFCHRKESALPERRHTSPSPEGRHSMECCRSSRVGSGCCTLLGGLSAVAPLATIDELLPHSDLEPLFVLTCRVRVDLFGHCVQEQRHLLVLKPARHRAISPPVISFEDGKRG
jgi:hypothetical protein